MSPHQIAQLAVWLVLSVAGLFFSGHSLHLALSDRQWAKERQINGNRDVVTRMMIRTAIARLTSASLALACGVLSFLRHPIVAFFIPWAIIAILGAQVLATWGELRDRERLM